MTNPHTDDRHPFWKVAAIYGDDDDKAGNFAYTVGLHTRGVPELWLSSRPSLGEDPGADWRFTLTDMGMLLNELSWVWLDGRLAIGDAFERTYDGGLTRLTLRVDPADDVEALQAFQIDPGAQVVPIRWSLHRPPPGANEPMTDEAVVTATSLLTLLTTPLDPDRPAPEGWAVPDEPAWSPDQRFGPRTPLVLARAAWLRSADGFDAVRLLSAVMEVNSVRRMSWPMTAIQAHARALGRADALEAASAESRSLVDLLLPEWLDELDEAVGLDDTVTAAHVRQVLVELVELTLTAEVVADSLPEEECLAALGILASAMQPPGSPAGEEWLASDLVRESVDELVRGTGPRGVVQISRIHLTTTAEGYDEIIMKLRALNATTACAWAPMGDLFDEDFSAELALERAEGEGIYIQEWGGLVAAMLTHRASFDAADVDAFTGPFEAAVPGLRPAINSPL